MGDGAGKMGNTPDQEDLVASVLEVLDGAEDVRTKVDAFLSLGNPSIRQSVYTAKSRVKTVNSAVNKIKKYRQGGQPNYGAGDLRDLVGARIVTLYEADKPKMLSNLLEMIGRANDAGLGLFSSGVPDEITIYHAPSTGQDQTLEIVRANLATLGYTTAESSRPRVVTDVKGSLYTSIHLVYWCVGNGSRGFRNIPVEFQIRNAFEDVWGEIDHSLKYKRDDDVPPHLKDIASSCHLMIGTLKEMLMPLSSHADNIRGMLAKLSGNESNRDAVGPSLDDTREFLQYTKLPPALEKTIKRALQQQESAAAVESGKEEHAVYRDGLLKAIDLWEAAFVECGRLLRDGQSREMAEYYIRMEQALCHFNAGVEAPDDVAKPHMMDALRIYRQMAEKYPSRPIVFYRLAEVLGRFNAIEQAIDAGRNAMENLEADDSVDKDSWLRVRIPRRLSYWLWEEADQIRRQGLETGFADFKLAARRESYLEAIKFTKQALDTPIADYQYGGRSWTNAMEQTLSLNNLVFYVLDYLRAGGEVAALERLGCDPEQLLEKGNTIDIDDGLPVRAKLDVLDTLRDLAAYDGRTERERQLAGAILATARANHIEESASDIHLTDILAAARNVWGDEPIPEVN